MPARSGSAKQTNALLRSLTGDEQSMLEITVSKDGTLHIYEAYSQHETEQLIARLKNMGIQVEILSSPSPCG